jgi:hypothetical protein
MYILHSLFPISYFPFFPFSKKEVSLRNKIECIINSLKQKIMSSTSETGHAKNVANFETEISFCTAYSAAYNPSKESLTIPALNELLSKSRNALLEVTNAKNVYDLAVNQRQIEFTTLKPLATRVINALDASGAPKQTLEDAKSINRKIQGVRSTPKSGQDEEKKTISTSQQSYDSLLENFSKLVELVIAEPAYAPNESELMMASLHTCIDRLRTANTNVINSYTVYSNAMISRDAVLYAIDTGLVDIALDVKKYVKSVFGATSPQYKQVSKLEFTRPR